MIHVDINEILENDSEKEIEMRKLPNKALKNNKVDPNNMHELT